MINNWTWLLQSELLAPFMNIGCKLFQAHKKTRVIKEVYKHIIEAPYNIFILTKM